MGEVVEIFETDSSGVTEMKIDKLQTFGIDWFQIEGNHSMNLSLFRLKELI